MYGVATEKAVLSFVVTAVRISDPAQARHFYFRRMTGNLDIPFSDCNGVAEVILSP